MLESAPDEVVQNCPLASRTHGDLAEKILIKPVIYI
jgi:hypothetical protein